MQTADSTAYFNWSGDHLDFKVAYHEFGSGPPVAFLPAMSTVSTRREWQGVAEALGDRFATTLVDWPGFGGSSRPPAAYSPALFDAFLRDFLRHRFEAPVSVVAAGHAAGYVLRAAATTDRLWRRAVLVAPTWRGPLPTVMGAHPGVYARLLALVRTPGVGHALYHINTSKWFLRHMYGRHVYVDQARLGARFLGEKQRLARSPGARFAAAAFVTGTLDPFRNQESCCEALRNAAFPVLLIIGKNTPPRSRVEMAALAKLCPRTPLLLEGSLGLHEEHPAALVPPIREFLEAEA